MKVTIKEKSSQLYGNLIKVYINNTGIWDNKSYNIDIFRKTSVWSKMALFRGKNGDSNKLYAGK